MTNVVSAEKKMVVKMSRNITEGRGLQKKTIQGNDHEKGVTIWNARMARIHYKKCSNIKRERV